MRSLTEEETRTLFTKLASYTGNSLKSLIAPPGTNPSDPSSAAPSTTDSASSSSSKRKSHPEARLPSSQQQHVFRLHNSRVYYVPLHIANLATSIARENLLSLGLCIGKFTKTGKFRMHITALDVIAPHARYKVWIKPNGEGPFTYGGHVVKAHVGRWSEEAPEHQGVVVCGMGDTPLGFGVTARSTTEAKRLEPTAIVTFRQADVGEYLREEDNLFSTTT